MRSTRYQENETDLVESLVMSVLIYNSCCWSLRICETEEIKVYVTDNMQHKVPQIINIKEE